MQNIIVNLDLPKHNLAEICRGFSGTVLRRRCVVCAKNNQATRSRYECSSCKVALCIEKCFVYYHENIAAFVWHHFVKSDNCDKIYLIVISSYWYPGYLKYKWKTALVCIKKTIFLGVHEYSAKRHAFSLSLEHEAPEIIFFIILFCSLQIELVYFLLLDPTC